MIKVHVQRDHTGRTKLCIIKHHNADGSWADDQSLDQVLVLEPEPHWEPLVEGAHAPDTVGGAREVFFVEYPDLPAPLWEPT